jgi:hypothetical protein
MLHCCFCDDASRPKSSNHGHLYLSEEFPVFHCFRCGTSGTLVSLLIYTGFDDYEIIKFISQFININFIKDHYKLTKRITQEQQKILRKRIFQLNYEFKSHYRNYYKIFIDYIYNRTGTYNFLNYLISPKLINQKSLCVNFTNFNGSNVLVNYINDEKKRYQINKQIQDNYYYFQSEDFESNSIVICEGPFDIINMDLYSHVFNSYNSVLYSINGKNYYSFIEDLIIRELLIGEYVINIIFDNDFKNKEKYIKRIVYLTKFYNREIQIKAFKPLLQEADDVAEFVALTEIEEDNS